MHRLDTALAVAAFAVLALLVAVSWRATPDQANVAVILYIVAGVLEAAGVVTIGLDLNSRRRRVRNYQAEVRIVNASARMTRESRLFATATVSGPVPTLEDRVRALEAHQAREPERIREATQPLKEELEKAMRFADQAIDTDARRREAQIVRLIGPSDSASAAWIGFGALLLGVLVGTAANIVSATA